MHCDTRRFGTRFIILFAILFVIIFIIHACRGTMITYKTIGDGLLLFYCGLMMYEVGEQLVK